MEHRSSLDFDKILAKKEILALETAKILQVRDGLVWVTAEGDPTDHILAPGDSIQLEGKAKIVIEALERSRVSLQWSEAQSLTPREHSPRGSRQAIPR